MQERDNGEIGILAAQFGNLICDVVLLHAVQRHSHQIVTVERLVWWTDVVGRHYRKPLGPSVAVHFEDQRLSDPSRRTPRSQRDDSASPPGVNRIFKSGHAIVCGVIIR